MAERQGRSEQGAQRQLVRRLGLAETTAVALGAMIGAGVYVSMGEAAGRTGGSLLLAVPLGALVATLNGLSAAELAVDDPMAGGAYRFGGRLLSPLVGFVAGWLLLLAGLTAGATFALTFAAYLAPILPEVPPRVIGLALLPAAVLLNALGVRLAARANVALVAVNVVILLAFAAMALPAFDPSHLQPAFAGGVVGLLEASALLFFAYTGYARPVTLAEEVRQPETTLPRAVGAALAITTALYLAVALAALGALPPDRLGSQEAPLRAALMEIGSPAGAVLVSLGAAIASSAVLLTEIWGMSRLAFAMARQGDLPAWFGQLSGLERIPRNAVLTAGGLLLLLVGIVDLRPALEASSLALLVYYAIMDLSALRLPARRRLYPSAIPAGGLAGCTLLAFSLPAVTVVVVLGLVGVAVVYYLIRHGRSD